MKPLWAGLAKIAVKVALYAAAHPDEVLAIVSAVQTAKSPRSPAPTA